MFPPAPDKEDGKAGSTGLFAATDNIREVDVFFYISETILNGFISFSLWLKTN